MFVFVNNLSKTPYCVITQQIEGRRTAYDAGTGYRDQEDHIDHVTCSAKLPGRFSISIEKRDCSAIPEAPRSKTNLCMNRSRAFGEKLLGKGSGRAKMGAKWLFQLRSAPEQRTSTLHLFDRLDTLGARKVCKWKTQTSQFKRSSRCPAPQGSPEGTEYLLSVAT